MFARFKRWLKGVRLRGRGGEVEILPPIKPPRARIGPRPGVSGPNHRRTAEVYVALEGAPAGLSYGQLMRHVKAAAGRACSRKLVARWKRERWGASRAAPLPVALAAIAAAALVSLTACRAGPDAGGASSVTPAPSPIVIGPADWSEPAGPGGGPRHLKITLRITAPDELWVKAGQRLAADDIISDRRAERERLEARRRALLMAARRVTEQRGLAAESLRLVERLGATLPPASYAAEEAALTRARAEAQAAGRRAEVQRRRVTLVPAAVPAGIDRGLVGAHEELRLAGAVDEERLALSEVALAEARLRSAKEARAGQERRQAMEAARQTLVAREQLQQSELAAAQLGAQLAELESQLGLLAAVRAPFAGRVERISWEEQHEHQITVSVYLAVGVAGGKP